ncbi:MAG: RNA polymerase sigma factor [Candidatus Jacksonbacteria bacterium]|nr:RNA polymerase sigma factor [Candidatus Jacksonbacteria bacterium]
MGERPFSEEESNKIPPSKSFDQLHSDYSDIVRMTLIQIQGLQQEDREDLSQQIWEKIFLIVNGKLSVTPVFPTPAHERAWIKRVAKNQAIDFVRSPEWKRRRAAGEIQIVDDRSAEETTGESVVLSDAHPSPLDRLEQEEIVYYMKEALKHVPPLYREVLETAQALQSEKRNLIHMIAERLQKKEPAIKSNLYRGRGVFALIFLNMYDRETLERCFPPLNVLSFANTVSLLTNTRRNTLLSSVVENRVREMKTKGETGELGSLGLSEEHFTEDNALTERGYQALSQTLRRRILNAAEAVCGPLFR